MHLINYLEMDNKLIKYRIFTSHKWLKAFTTTKQTLPEREVQFTGDEKHIYTVHRTNLATKLGIREDQLLFPRQTHSSKVCKIDEVPESELSGTDALVTNRPGFCICVQTADCVPILIADPRQKVIAAVHAGWRGTVARIVQHTINTMKEDYGCRPVDLIAAVGPSIGPEIYEVGNEVVEAVKNNISKASLTLKIHDSGKYHFNLWEANRQLLLDSGLLNANIEVLEACSYSEKDKFYSARREGVNTGRMVSGIMLVN